MQAGLEGLAVGHEEISRQVFCAGSQTSRSSGLGRAEAHVAGAQGHHAVGQAQAAQHLLRRGRPCLPAPGRKSRARRPAPSRPCRTGAGGSCRACRSRRCRPRAEARRTGRSGGWAGRRRPRCSRAPCWSAWLRTWKSGIWSSAGVGLAQAVVDLGIVVAAALLVTKNMSSLNLTAIGPSCRATAWRR